MTQYNVYLYREMRLIFEGIEADTAETAASIARDKPTDDANDIEDCEGESLAALVDVVGVEQFEQSEIIDFEQEKQRKLAPKLLAALKGTLYALDGNREGSGPSKRTAIENALAAIAEADASEA